jgi:hypothetical protein
MVLIYKRPTDLVRHMTSPGLNTNAGPVPVGQYMSGSIGNGGSDTAVSFYGNMRSKLTSAGVTNSEIDILLKGQGSPSAMVKVMNYVVANKASLTFNIDVQHRSGEKNSVITHDYKGSFYKRYFGSGESDLVALRAMVKDKIFGLDCVGFVANWMVFAGIWDKYQPYEIYQWNKLFPNRVTSYDDITDMAILVWGGYHIGIVDSITDWHVSRKGAEVVLCQSSSGGPRKDIVTLFEKRDDNGEVVFEVNGNVPVKGHVKMWRRDDLVYARPTSAALPQTPDLETPVGQWQVRVGKWLWVYDFAQNGSVTWRDPFNGENGAGRWTLKPDVSQMATTWAGSQTTETWDLPLHSDKSTGRVRMQGKLYDLAATRAS